MFSITILSLLGFLLLSLIKPYYRESQIKIIDTITKTVEDDLINRVPEKKDIEEIARLVIDSNACMLIYNQQGKKIYEKNSIGEICQFNEKISINNMPRI